MTALANDTLSVTWDGSSHHGYEMQWFKEGSGDLEKRSVSASEDRGYHEEVTGLEAGSLYNVSVRTNSTSGLGELFSQTAVTC